MSVKITFLGGGNMANAIIGGLLAAKSAERISGQQIAVLDVNAESVAKLTQAYDVIGATDIATVPLGEVLVLAVKPQNARELATLLAPRITALTRPCVVLSIAAGIRIRDLSRWLGGFANIVRSMPNTPALVHAGISGIFAPASIPVALKDAASRVLEAVGEVVWCDHESDLDAVTAVSGSGPAYVFYMIEALTQAAVNAGLKEEAALRLAKATFVGAAKLANESTETPGVLRQRVTSKGGTTERGLAALAERDVAAAIKQAVAQATARSTEMGDTFGAQ